jgi:hypothetical protein
MIGGIFEVLGNILAEDTNRRAKDRNLDLAMRGNWRREDDDVEVEEEEEEELWHC